MNHFKFLWMDMVSWWRHLLYAEHDQEQMVEEISENVNAHIDTQVSRTVREEIEPIVKQQRDTARMMQSTVDALKRRGIDVEIPGGEVHAGSNGHSKPG